MVAEVQILKGLGKAVLDSSAFDKSILVFVDQKYDYILKPISKKFSDQFHGAVKEGNRSEVRQTDGALDLGNQGDKRGVNTLKADIVLLKSPT